jgi:hypothetical protein
MMLPPQRAISSSLPFSIQFIQIRGQLHHRHDSQYSVLRTYLMSKLKRPAISYSHSRHRVLTNGMNSRVRLSANKIVDLQTYFTHDVQLFSK